MKKDSDPKQDSNATRVIKFDLSKDKLPEIPKVTTIPKAPSVYPTKKEEEKKDLREFSLRKEFDTNTYGGRFRQMFSRINPLLFFVPKKTILECKEKLDKYNMRQEAADRIGAKIYLTPEEIEEIKYASRVVGSAVHPDTGEIIPFYMKMSGFVPFNMPLVFAVLFVRNQTPVFNATMQWLNQTYNAAMNYGNRNASSTYTLGDLGRGYAGAVAVSVSIALFSRMALAKQLSKLHGSKQIIANAFLNYLAGAFAGASNLVLMRFKETQDGIKIQNQEGDVTYGQSKLAAKKAIMETAITRFLLPIPVLFFPAIANFALERLRLWPRNNIIAKLLELTLVTVSLTFALPMSVAMFEQRSKMHRLMLEPEFHEIKDEKTTELVENFYFNKGL